MACCVAITYLTGLMVRPLQRLFGLGRNEAAAASPPADATARLSRPVRR